MFLPVTACESFPQALKIAADDSIRLTEFWGKRVAAAAAANVKLEEDGIHKSAKTHADTVFCASWTCALTF